MKNKHIKLRYVLPKGTDLHSLGFADQTDLNLVPSHVHSAPVEIPNRKSPLDLTDFIYHELCERLEAFGIHKIEKDKIILKPYLPKKINIYRWLSGRLHMLTIQMEFSPTPRKSDTKDRSFGMQ